MKPWRWTAFLRAYEHLPHAQLDRIAGRLMRREHPRWLVRAAIAVWIRRGRIDLDEVVVEDWPTLEAFFLRRLRPGTRPLGAGLTSPVDGIVVASGPADAGLVVKGTALDVATLCGRPLDFEAEAVTVFLTPDGYHRIHAPADLELRDAHTIAGRSFPQNDDALAFRPDVYLANARVVVRAETAEGPLVMVLVGASLISGIEVAPAGRYAKGDELGAFRFGSTVVLLWPRARGRCTLAAGTPVKLGETLVDR